MERFSQHCPGFSVENPCPYPEKPQSRANQDGCPCAYEICLPQTRSMRLSVDAASGQQGVGAVDGWEMPLPLGAWGRVQEWHEQ